MTKFQLSCLWQRCRIRVCSHFSIPERYSFQAKTPYYNDKSLILRKVTSQLRSPVTVSSIMRSVVLSVSRNLQLFQLICQSPYTDTFHAHHPVCITLDSSAMATLIRHSLVTHLGGQLSPTSQCAHQADRCSPLKVVGETRLSFTCANREFSFEGLVMLMTSQIANPVSKHLRYCAAASFLTSQHVSPFSLIRK